MVVPRSKENTSFSSPWYVPSVILRRERVRAAPQWSVTGNGCSPDSLTARPFNPMPSTTVFSWWFRESLPETSRTTRCLQRGVAELSPDLGWPCYEHNVSSTFDNATNRQQLTFFSSSSHDAIDRSLGLQSQSLGWLEEARARELGRAQNQEQCWCAGGSSSRKDRKLPTDQRR